MPRKIPQTPHRPECPRTSLSPGYVQWTDTNSSYGLERKIDVGILPTWANENDKTSSHSVAYACGFGYNSFFTFANHSPRSVSNTSLHNEVKNSLNTPPPSIPALGKKKESEIRKPKVENTKGIKTKPNALLLPKLINKRNLNRRLQIHLPKPIKPILRHHPPPHLNPLLPIRAPQTKEPIVTLYVPGGRHVVHDKMLEDRDADFERDGERDIIEDPKARWHCGYLAFGEGTWVVCAGLR